MIANLAGESLPGSGQQPSRASFDHLVGAAEHSSEPAGMPQRCERSTFEMKAAAN